MAGIETMTNNNSSVNSTASVASKKDETTKIGVVKERKTVHKETSSAQTAQDFLWAHFVAPLEIEEDNIDGKSERHLKNDPKDMDEQELDDHSISESETPDKSMSSESDNKNKVVTIESPHEAERNEKRKEKLEKNIRLKPRSPSPVPTPPPIPTTSEIRIQLIDGNYVKIGLRPLDRHVIDVETFDPYEHLKHIQLPPIHSTTEGNIQMDSESDDKEIIFKILRKKFPWFKLLKFDDQENVLDLFKYQTFKRTSLIYRQGDDPSGMYFIDEGSVDIVYDRVYKDNLDLESKASFLIASEQAGAFFGEIECRTGQKRFAKAVANSDIVKVLFLPISAFNQFIIPNVKIAQGFDAHLDLYRSQLQQFDIKDLGERIGAKVEKDNTEKRKHAAEYLWSHFYEEVGADNESQARAKPHPREVNRGCELLDYMFKLWMENRMCDAIIRVRHYKLPVHRLLLTMFCEKYEQLTEESGDPRKILMDNENVSVTNILQTLYYLYTNKIHISKENVEGILTCAIKFGIPTLISMCKNFVETYYEEGEIVLLGETLKKLRSLSLEKRMQTFLNQEFKDLVMKPEFCAIPPDMLLKLLAKDEIKIDNELQILEGLVKWLNADSLRIPLTSNFLRCVRYQEITVDDLLKISLSNPNIFERDDCKLWMINALSYHALKKSDDKPLKSSRKSVSKKSSASTVTTIQSDPKNQPTKSVSQESIEEKKSSTALRRKSLAAIRDKRLSFKASDNKLPTLKNEPNEITQKRDSKSDGKNMEPSISQNKLDNKESLTTQISSKTETTKTKSILKTSSSNVNLEQKKSEIDALKTPKIEDTNLEKQKAVSISKVDSQKQLAKSSSAADKTASLETKTNESELKPTTSASTSDTSPMALRIKALSKAFGS